MKDKSIDEYLEKRAKILLTVGALMIISRFSWRLGLVLLAFILFFYIKNRKKNEQKK